VKELNIENCEEKINKMKEQNIENYERKGRK
jgi:hypothetical protein